MDKFLQPRAPCTRQPYKGNLSSQKFNIEAAGIKNPCRPSVNCPFSTVGLSTVPIFSTMDNIQLNKLQTECRACVQDSISPKNHENCPKNGKFFNVESAQKVYKPLKFPPYFSVPKTGTKISQNLIRPITKGAPDHKLKFALKKSKIG